MTENKEWPDNKQHREADAVDRQIHADLNQAPNRMPGDDEKTRAIETN